MASTLRSVFTSGVSVAESTWLPYDYIIVGAGSAGCVVAARLSEDADVRVLLLEAGDNDQSAIVSIPAGFMLLRGSRYDWNLSTQKDSGTHDRVHTWPRGRVIGGCSAINAMAYVRGDPVNYDEWESEHGCHGWSYNDVLPYFKKSEHNVCSGRFAKAEPDSHGYDGPVMVSDPGRGQPQVYAERFVQAAQQAGFKLNDDYNGRQQSGVSWAQLTIDNGERCCSARAFLRPVLSRKNLTVLTNVHVHKIVMQGRTAVGVHISFTNHANLPVPPPITPPASSTAAPSFGLAGGAPTSAAAASSPLPPPPPAAVSPIHLHFIAARREVVVCAGATHSPHLLMLSGIGPKSHLKSMGIPVVADLPVGENLQDHLMCPLAVATHDTCTADALSQWSMARLSALASYVRSRTGSLTSSGIESFLFTKTGLAAAANATRSNDLQFHFTSLIPPLDIRQAWGIPNWLTDIKTGVNMAASHGITFFPSLIQPLSRGSIRLQSSSAMIPPVIHAGYFSDKDDVDLNVIVRGLQLARQLTRQPIWHHTLGDEQIDPQLASHYHVDSIAYLQAYARKYSFTIFHPVGTCRMGPTDRITTVVDCQLRVKGVRRLRVIDASIMPAIISGNTNAPVYMIAEKGADMIKSDWQQRQRQSSSAVQPSSPSLRSLTRSKL